jgi:hypothetical protein
LHFILPPRSSIPIPKLKWSSILSLRPNSIVVRIVSIDGTGARDLVPRATACAPIWSGPSTLWVSQRGPEGIIWRELDVASGARTGKTAPGHGDCINNDPDPPIHPSVWRTVADDWDVRLFANSGL